jgi:hypothetical protein
MKLIDLRDAPASPAEDLVHELDHHSRHCKICHHPHREQIEEAFIHWARPSSIVRQHGIRHRSLLYRHARATGLYKLRANNLRSALEHIIERAPVSSVTSDTVIRAVRTYAHLTEDGQWIEPVRKLMVIKQEPQEQEVNFVVSPELFEVLKTRRKNEEQREASQNLPETIEHSKSPATSTKQTTDPISTRNKNDTSER